MGELATSFLAVVGAVIILWLTLLAALIACRPADLNPIEAVRLLPDTVVLIRRLAADPALPRGVQIRLFLMLAYLVLPIDLVPDFLPIIGNADDAIVIAIALRAVVRCAGIQALDVHWPGTPAGLEVIARLAGKHTRQHG